MTVRFPWWGFVLPLVLVTCGVSEAGEPGPATTVVGGPPEFPEGAAAASQSSREARPRWLLSLVDAALAAEFDDPCEEMVDLQAGTKSLVVFSQGFVVCQQHREGGDLHRTTNVKSASKSVLSLLVGIAVDEGLLTIDQPAADLLPELLRDGDVRKRRILVADLLRMSTGMASTSFDGYGAWVAARNQVRAAAEMPMVAEPGSELSYSTGVTHLLSAVLQRASGLSPEAYAKRLFGPLGIRPGGWETDRQGLHYGGNNLALSPLDLGKIGALILQRGAWRGEQVVSQAWLDLSLRPTGLRSDRRVDDYGMLWWLRPGTGHPVAVGFGGQLLYVDPERRSVTVVTATLDSKGREWEDEWFGWIEGSLASMLARARPKLELLADQLSERGGSGSGGADELR